MSRMDKAQQEERFKKISAAITRADADAPAGGDRIGSLTRSNAELVKLLVEEIFMALTPQKKRTYLAALNEIFCYIGMAANQLERIS